jgi:hypothetical protein
MNVMDAALYTMRLVKDLHHLINGMTMIDTIVSGHNKIIFKKCLT